MTGRFPAQCLECGAWDHKMANCPHRTGGAESVDESVDRQAFGSEGQGSLAIYSLPLGHEVGGPFGTDIKAVFRDNQQQQQAQAAPGSLDGVPGGHVGKRHFGLSHNVSAATVGGLLEDFKKKTGSENPMFLVMSAEVGREMENHLAQASESAEARQRLRDLFRGLSPIDITSAPGSGSSNEPMPVQPRDQAARDRERFSAAIAESKRRIHDRRAARQLDMASIPILGRPDTVEPVRPQGQAGRGSLPGARDVQPNRAGAGLLGNYRVERPGAARGLGQQPRQRTTRGGTQRLMHLDDEEEEVMDDAGSVPSQGQESIAGGRGVPGGMAQEQGGAGNHGAQADNVTAYGLTARGIHSLIDRTAANHLLGTRFTFRPDRAPSKEDRPASSDVIRGHFLDAFASPVDSFSFDPGQVRMESAPPPPRANEATSQQSHQEDADEDGDELDVPIRGAEDMGRE